MRVLSRAHAARNIYLNERGNNVEHKPNLHLLYFPWLTQSTINDEHHRYVSKLCVRIKPHRSRYLQLTTLGKMRNKCSECATYRYFLKLKQQESCLHGTVQYSSPPSTSTVLLVVLLFWIRSIMVQPATSRLTRSFRICLQIMYKYYGEFRSWLFSLFCCRSFFPSPRTTPCAFLAPLLGFCVEFLAEDWC